MFPILQGKSHYLWRQREVLFLEVMPSDWGESRLAPGLKKEGGIPAVALEEVLGKQMSLILRGLNIWV